MEKSYSKLQLLSPVDILIVVFDRARLANLIPRGISISKGRSLFRVGERTESPQRLLSFRTSRVDLRQTETTAPYTRFSRYFFL